MPQMNVYQLNAIQRLRDQGADPRALIDLVIGLGQQQAAVEEAADIREENKRRYEQQFKRSGEQFEKQYGLQQAASERSEKALNEQIRKLDEQIRQYEQSFAASEKQRRLSTLVNMYNAGFDSPEMLAELAEYSDLPLTVTPAMAAKYGIPPGTPISGVDIEALKENITYSPEQAFQGKDATGLFANYPYSLDMTGSGPLQARMSKGFNMDIYNQPRPGRKVSHKVQYKYGGVGGVLTPEQLAARGYKTEKWRRGVRASQARTSAEDKARMDRRFGLNTGTATKTTQPQGIMGYSPKQGYVPGPAYENEDEYGFVPYGY